MLKHQYPFFFFFFVAPHLFLFLSLYVVPSLVHSFELSEYIWSVCLIHFMTLDASNMSTVFDWSFVHFSNIHHRHHFAFTFFVNSVNILILKNAHTCAIYSDGAQFLLPYTVTVFVATMATIDTDPTAAAAATAAAVAAMDSK